MDDYLNNEEKRASDGIFKIEEGPLRDKILEMSIKDKKSEVLKLRAEYLKMECTNNAIFHREDGKMPHQTGYVGVNIEKLCYVTEHTHEGPSIPQEFKKTGIQANQAIDESEALHKRSQEMMQEEIWPEIYNKFNLEEANGWHINFLKMTVSRSPDGPTGMGEMFRKLMGGG